MHDQNVGASNRVQYLLQYYCIHLQQNLSLLENFGMSVLIRCENDLESKKLFMIEMQVREGARDQDHVLDLGVRRFERR